MKTTLNLNDEVLRRSRESAARPPFRLALRTVQGTRPPNVDISDRNALYDVIDHG